MEFKTEIFFQQKEKVENFNVKYLLPSVNKNMELLNFIKIRDKTTKK